MPTLNKYVKLANLLDDLGCHDAAEIVDQHMNKDAAPKRKEQKHYMIIAREDLKMALTALDEGNVGTALDVAKHAIYALDMAVKTAPHPVIKADLQLEMEKEVEEKEEEGEKGEETEEVEVSKKKKLVLKFD